MFDITTWGRGLSAVAAASAIVAGPSITASATPPGRPDTDTATLTVSDCGRVELADDIEFQQWCADRSQHRGIEDLDEFMHRNSPNNPNSTLNPANPLNPTNPANPLSPLNLNNPMNHR